MIRSLWRQTSYCVLLFRYVQDNSTIWSTVQSQAEFRSNHGLLFHNRIREGLLTTHPELCRAGASVQKERAEHGTDTVLAIDEFCHTVPIQEPDGILAAPQEIAHSGPVE